MRSTAATTGKILSTTVTKRKRHTAITTAGKKRTTTRTTGKDRITSSLNNRLWNSWWRLFYCVCNSVCWYEYLYHV